MAKTRSQMMAAIPQASTRPEVVLAAALEQHGWAVQTGQKVLGVRVDLVLPDWRAVVLVDGCFWHGCPLHYVRPKGNPAYWAHKLATNVERDLRQTTALRDAQWNVVRIWEHAVERDADAAALSVIHRCEQPSHADAEPRVIAVEPTEQVDGDGHSLDLYHLIGLGDGCRQSVLRPRSPSARDRL